MGDAPPSDMDQQVEASVSRKKFFVFLAGITNGAHQDIVAKLKSVGQTQVTSPDKSDYLLVFCPIASRVETDINVALRKTPDDKPIILVVMHHTFDSGHVAAESRRHVENPNVCLTVDYLFYERSLLKCPLNDTSWSDMQNCLGVSASQVSWRTTWENLWKWLRSPRTHVGFGVVFAVLLISYRYLPVLVKMCVGESENTHTEM